MDDLIKYDGNNAVIGKEVIDQITSIEQEIKLLKSIEDDMKSKLLKAMKENGVKQIKNDSFTISYTPEHTVERLDTKALQKDFGTICDKYMKETKVKDSIRITLAKE